MKDVGNLRWKRARAATTCRSELERKSFRSAKLRVAGASLAAVLATPACWCSVVGSCAWIPAPRTEAPHVPGDRGWRKHEAPACRGDKGASQVATSEGVRLTIKETASCHLLTKPQPMAGCEGQGRHNKNSGSSWACCTANRPLHSRELTIADDFLLQRAAEIAT